MISRSNSIVLIVALLVVAYLGCLGMLFEAATFQVSPLAPEFADQGAWYLVDASMRFERGVGAAVASWSIAAAIISAAIELLIISTGKHHYA
jgi:uncharacterized membrane protein (GlpM family)